MRDLVRGGLYVMTVHDQEEMEADGLTLEDVEHVLSTGEIVQRQNDQHTGEAKYLLEGDIQVDARRHQHWARRHRQPRSDQRV